MFGDYSEEYNYGIEKANGIEYLYAWLGIHPDVRAMVTKSTGMWFE
jgi:hypothetical protein